MPTPPASATALKAAAAPSAACLSTKLCHIGVCNLAECAGCPVCATAAVQQAVANGSTASAIATPAAPHAASAPVDGTGTDALAASVSTSPPPPAAATNATITPATIGASV